ncbi:hypothetical protein FQA39_LY11938 [Lamprigera yunnana]|nr:hypothetical protein FQA39_LY11938 [Lamprigera yunnana]
MASILNKPIAVYFVLILFMYSESKPSELKRNCQQPVNVASDGTSLEEKVISINESHEINVSNANVTANNITEEFELIPKGISSAAISTLSGGGFGK